MALRDLAGGAARMSAGFWKEVAKAIEPDRPSSKPRPEPPPQAETVELAGDPTQVPGGVLVPVETWTRVLDQLGNLHEAGQELAEARERAAKAETQVVFLREQLADAKARPKRTRAAPTPKRAPADTPVPRGATDPTGARAGGSPRMEAFRSARRVRVVQARNRVSSWLQVDPPSQ